MKVLDDNFILFGRYPQEVLKEVRQRKENNYFPLAKSSPTKLALIIEGGGMRGIIAGGFLVAMHRFGLYKIFDKIYGISAGALGGAYFLSGQSPYGVSTFYEEINNRQFINLSKAPHFFNIDYLIEIIKDKKKLDVEAVKRSPTELIVTATDIESGWPRYFSNREDIDFLLALKASCALPIYYDRPVEIEGKKYLDGGIVTPLPVFRAIKDGCTHILIIMTKPRERPDYTKLPFWFEIWHLKKYGNNFIRSYYARNKYYQQTLRLIEDTSVWRRDISIAAIAPTNQNINFYTIDPTKLKRAYQLSYSCGLNLFLPLFKINAQADYPTSPKSPKLKGLLPNTTSTTTK